MPAPSARTLERFHRLLVDEIRRNRPRYLSDAFTVAEIYQSLVPYRTHRDRLGVEMNGDYEDALLRLLAGEGGYLTLESDPARERIRRELQHANPNTGIYREFAAVSVRLHPGALSGLAPTVPPVETKGAGESGATSRSEGPLGTESRTPNAGSASTTGAEAGGPPSAPPGEGRLDGDPAVSGGPGTSRPSADASPAAGERPVSCPDCDEALPERTSLRFCPHCGADVWTVPCGACGETLERGWRFCVACGTATGG